jgi:hypothetical protein
MFKTCIALNKTFRKTTLLILITQLNNVQTKKPDENVWVVEFTELNVKVMLSRKRSN